MRGGSMVLLTGRVVGFVMVNCTLFDIQRFSSSGTISILVVMPLVRLHYTQ